MNQFDNGVRRLAFICTYRAYIMCIIIYNRHFIQTEFENAVTLPIKMTTR